MKRFVIASVSTLALLLFMACSSSDPLAFYEVGVGSTIVIADVEIRVTESMGAPGIVYEDAKDAKDAAGTAYVNFHVNAVEDQANIGTYLFSIPKDWLKSEVAEFLEFDPKQRTFVAKIEKGKILVALRPNAKAR